MADNKPKNRTVYQKLSNILTPDGVNHNLELTNKYSMGSDVLLKTTNKEEYKQATLQAKQTTYLRDMWGKVEDNLFQQSIQYEMTRIGAYSDFENMEFYPELAATLDIFMEESTTVNDKGRVLNVYSDSPRIRGVLEDLFFNRLDIHTVLPMWVRNTPIREDSIIPLLDGTEITIKELSAKVNAGEEMWTYSVQKDTNAVVGGKIVWCDLTRKDSELIRVTLDDDTHIDTTPDHEYMLRDGSYVRADKLEDGVSLMPFYTNFEKIRRSDKNGYEKVYNPATNRYKFTHRMVANEYSRDLDYENTVDGIFVSHHVDFNKLNNNPSNLVRMESSEHTKLNNRLGEIGKRVLNKPEVVKKRLAGIDKYLRSDERRERLSKEMSGIYPKYFEEYNNSELHTEHNDIRSEKMLDAWGDEGYNDSVKKLMTISLNDNAYNHIVRLLKESDVYVGINKLANILKTDAEFIKLFSVGYTLRKSPIKAINPTTLNKMIRRKSNMNYFDFTHSIKPNIASDKSYMKAKAIHKSKTKVKVLNHKVLSVIKLTETSDVYCMEVVGPNGEHDRHNFPVCSKDSEGNYTRNGTFLMNCKYGDNFVYLNTNDQYGITSAKQMPNFEMERREGGVYDTISARMNSVGNNTKDRSGEGKEERVRFFWRGRDLEFESWQIAHFRLLGDDRRLPYGTSVLEKSRRIWKQLLLSEDAMLVYRVTRAPERRVYKIYVGNIDDEDVQPYVNEIANRFKRSNVIDPQTGQVDLKYNQLANDQDFFIPVRDENAPNPIDTLPGASNLDQIADIEYLQRKLFTALRVPKSFLGFDDPQGDGKNLALMDVRFARTINRIQQALLQELNKIAIIHLVLLGFEDDLNSFTITMNNPSTQAEMLRIEHLQSKFAAVQAAVVDAGNGFGIMSMTRAKRDILGWSDAEIKQDLLEQRMEKAAAAELANTASVIKNTGFFDKVDKLYGDMEIAKKGGQSGEEDGGAGGPAGGGGGGFGGGGMGGDDIDFGDEEDDAGGEDLGDDIGGGFGDAGGDAGDDVGGDTDAPEPTDVEELTKTLKIGQRILAEQKAVLTNNLTKRRQRFKNIHMNRLLGTLTGNDKEDREINENRVNITDKGMRINQNVDDMLKDISKRIDDANGIK